MERYADEVERGFAASPTFDVRSTTVRSVWVGEGRPSGLSRYVTNFVRYPFHVTRCEALLYHVIDHGYAHLAALLPRDRTVITCHDLIPLLGEEGVAGFRARRRTVLRFRWSISYLRKVAHVVCVSQATADDVQRLCDVPPERLSVIANGIDTRFRVLPKEMVERTQQEMRRFGAHMVLHVCSEGGFPYKNVAMTFRVLASLRGEGVDVALTRVGRPLAPDERRLAEDLGVADVILDCGHVSDERLVELYNASDALLYPSHYEGFGLPALESMACGTPVVASTAPALVELVNGAGLMARPDDRDGLVALLGEVLTSEEMAGQLRHKGLVRAAGYSWQRTVESLANVYQKVIDAGSLRQER
jgi:glycosyltransferase involved in cell wall biosynthesis